ncbi:MAG TPA: tRNA pseudouridine synthase A [Planctomycetota bacterium]|nr:tRNA pseudouridine synthase A [Planctomycetota bacterium]
MPRFALELEFDGQGFSGTQLQDDASRTLQGVVETALADLAGSPVRFLPASRLDQGVSSPALPGDCVLERDWDPAMLAAALNQRLPEDAVVRRAARVADGFSARRDASAKHYRYRVLVRPARPVIDRRCLWVRRWSRPEALPEMAALLVGRLDLSGFACKRGDASDDGDPRRRYDHASWTDDGDGAWTFAMAGEGFLYQQIRGLVGAMVHVALDRAPIGDFRAAIAGGWGARRLGNMAPGIGLRLARVDFTPEPDWRDTR